jgi:rhodanese-related sulfurtransferase
MPLKFILDNWMLVAVALASGTMLVWPLVRKTTGGPWVGTARAIELINREDALVLDVRDAGEYGAGHILGARNVPLARIEEGGELGKRKDRPVIVYCEGTERSAKAMSALKRHGFTRAFNLSGGLNAWQQAGLPIEK